MRRVGAAVMMLVLGSAVLSSQEQAVQKVSYESFCSLPDLDAKRKTFNEITGANRAEVVRTQMERWRDVHRAKLSAPQLELLGQIIAAITPELYTAGPGREEARAKVKPLEGRMMELFAMEDVQAMQRMAPCLPKGKQAAR